MNDISAVVDAIEVGNNMMRLVATEKGTKSIQLWSSLSKEWRTMYRHKVDREWAEWKKLSKRLEDRV